MQKPEQLISRERIITFLNQIAPIVEKDKTSKALSKKTKLVRQTLWRWLKPKNYLDNSKQSDLHCLPRRNWLQRNPFWKKPLSERGESQIQKQRLQQFLGVEVNYKTRSLLPILLSPLPLHLHFLLQDMFATRSYTLLHVPKAVRPAWARVLGDVLCDISSNSLLLDSWLTFFMLPKCILSTPSRGGHGRWHDIKSNSIMSYLLEGQGFFLSCQGEHKHPCQLWEYCLLYLQSAGRFQCFSRVKVLSFHWFL